MVLHLLLLLGVGQRTFTLIPSFGVIGTEGYRWPPRQLVQPIARVYLVAPSIALAYGVCGVAPDHAVV